MDVPLLSPPSLMNLIGKYLPHLDVFLGTLMVSGWQFQNRFAIKKEGQHVFNELWNLPAAFSSKEDIFLLKSVSRQNSLLSVSWSCKGLQCYLGVFGVGKTSISENPRNTLAGGISKTIKTSENIRRGEISKPCEPCGTSDGCVQRRFPVLVVSILVQLCVTESLDHLILIYVWGCNKSRICFFCSMLSLTCNTL